MKKSWLALMVVLALTLVACGDDDDDNADDKKKTDDTEEESRDDEEASAEDWADQVCPAVEDMAADVEGLSSDANELDPNASPEELKEQFVTLLDDFSTTIETAMEEVEDAGVPDVEGGEEYVEDLLNGLETAHGLFSDARDRIEAVDPNNLEEFRSEFQGVDNDLTEGSETLADAFGSAAEDAPEELADAFADKKECEALEDIAGSLG